MNLLLDTHAFLWFLESNSQLSNAARALVEDENNDVLLSVGSLWEMAIKLPASTPLLMRIPLPDSGSRANWSSISFRCRYDSPDW